MKDISDLLMLILKYAISHSTFIIGIAVGFISSRLSDYISRNLFRTHHQKIVLEKSDKIFTDNLSSDIFLGHRIVDATSQGDDNAMDPVVLIGIIGSIASIVSFLQQNNIAITPDSVGKQFFIRASSDGSRESELQKAAGGYKYVENEIYDYLSMLDTAPLFEERIRKRCLSPYKDAINDSNIEEDRLSEIYEKTRICVCQNIRLARDNNEGEFPSEALRLMWRKFRCQM